MVWYGIPLLLSPGELFHGISIAWLIFESSQLNWLAALSCAPIQLEDFRVRELEPLPEAGGAQVSDSRECTYGP
jgi:hypothetical protein